MFARSLLFFAAALACAGIQESVPHSKPNIVLILADLRCYGRKEHDTPNLDRLAGEGMRFASVLLRAADLFAVARGGRSGVPSSEREEAGLSRSRGRNHHGMDQAVAR